MTPGVRLDYYFPEGMATNKKPKLWGRSEFFDEALEVPTLRLLPRSGRRPTPALSWSHGRIHPAASRCSADRSAQALG